MASIAVLIIILGSAALFWFKGTLSKSFAFFFSSVIGLTIAFSYFEPLGDLLIGKAKNETMLPWSYTIGFLVIFIISFAVVTVITVYLTKLREERVGSDDKIASTIIGGLGGLVVSGTVLASLSLAPMEKIPYQRFDGNQIDLSNPNKVIFNADGFVTGWFSKISKGSLSGKNSFAVMRPDFLNQNYLNQHFIKQNVAALNKNDALEIPSKLAVWSLDENLVKSDGQPYNPPANTNPVVIKIGFKPDAAAFSEKYVLAQVVAVCKEDTDAANPTSGSGINIYPAGYLTGSGKLAEKTSLSDIIDLNVTGKDNFVNFVFPVPQGYTPVLVKFRQNSIAGLPKPASAEQVQESEMSDL